MEKTGEHSDGSDGWTYRRVGGRKDRLMIKWGRWIGWINESVPFQCLDQKVHEIMMMFYVSFRSVT